MVRAAAFAAGAHVAFSSDAASLLKAAQVKNAAHIMPTVGSSTQSVKPDDFFPAMVEKLGAEGFMEELSKGFRLLTDGEKGMITFESLKKNSGLLGLQGMSDEEIMCMLKEGDLDGDGALDEMEFCTLMFRLSPAMMQSSQELLVVALDM
ncbi:calcium-binding protein KIC-like [Pyrus communis]|uniref:calcium-binding protein KIC-like n=1 Tax=Pyrus communis TaxID=23211 RepID=UPI0035C1944F